MEFVHGTTLEEELRDRRPFDVDRVIKIGVELSHALSTIHRAGLLHGDVKAQNVLCDRDGRLVLTDFGAGIELEEISSGAPRELAGTPLCVAPEVLVGHSASPRTDLYSLAVLLYHLLTGTYPVRGRSLKEIRDAHASGLRVPLHEARPDLPHAFERIIERAIDPDPGARHESLDAFHAELSALIPKDADASRTDVEPAVARRRRRLWVTAVAVLAVIVSTTALMLYRAQTVPNAIDAKIARRVFAPLSQLLGVDTRWPTVAPEAYELYLRGSAAAERGGQSGRLALQLYEQAIALDPAFAQAHAAIAHLALNNVASLGLRPEQRYERAKAAAERAMALDAQLREAHLAAARVKSAARDWPGAEGEYRRAIELAPNSSLFRREYAMWLSLHARFTEAIAEADRSIRLDPLSPRSHYMAGLVRRFARKCEEAGPHLRKALELDPQYGPAHQEIGQCHQMARRHDLAIEEYRRAAQPPGNLGHALAMSGRTAEARTLLAELIERHGESGDFNGIAIIYVGLGEYERALDWLERDLSPFGVGTFKVAAVWDPVRSHPRFAQILRKRGLAP
jgi:tetratricopeptide (TPR) repeat protein